MDVLKGFSVARIGWGLALVAAPAPLVSGLGLSSGPDPSSEATAVCRVLGVRHVAQGALGVLVPRKSVVGAGVVVDVLHSASMFGWAASAPDRRRAWVDASSAAAWAVLGALVVRRTD